MYLQTGAAAEYIGGTLNIREFSGQVALEEQAKLFDRKRPQIVAMWCVENAVSAWEKVRARLFGALHSPL